MTATEKDDLRRRVEELMEHAVKKKGLVGPGAVIQVEVSGSGNTIVFGGLARLAEAFPLAENSSRFGGLA